MIEAYGLKTHIWNNNLRSVLLLILFPILLMVIAYALILLWTGFTSDGSAEAGMIAAAQAMPEIAPIAIGGAAAWFGVAFLGHQKMIEAATKSRSVNISEEPRAYRMLENLSISRGKTMPRLKVIETPQMNAFASGIRDSNYTVTLTRGLMDNLDDEELEAVIAHELSHIQHKDVRLLIIAVIFVGIFAFIGEGVVRGVMRTNLSRSESHRRSSGGNAGALVLFAIALIGLTYLFAVLVRFSLSRKREYMADAGAVDLTKNPDAMIRALTKISGNAELNAPAEIMEMAIENPRTGFAGMFATHPPIEKRIDALVKFGGGRLGSTSRPPRRVVKDDDVNSGERQDIGGRVFGKKGKTSKPKKGNDFGPTGKPWR
ncbi:M48 family metallopeptidase [Litorimonas sp. RW-G-Af-16]|uniref:M48 family metallopeptidase n=1 Tax=Litorimonas sp. RW-G-Af-16 TaxID=3241168 RepID=UPI00390C9286